MIPQPYLAMPDLTHGYYPQIPPIPGADPKLNDVLDYLAEKGVSEYRLEQETAQNPHGGDPIPAGVIVTGDGNIAAPVVFVFSYGGKEYRAEVSDIWTHPSNLIASLNGAFGLSIPPYPGYGLRHATYPSPVGAEWPEHPWRRAGVQFMMYRPSNDFHPREWHVDDIHREIRGERVMAFKLVLFWAVNRALYAWQDVSTIGERA